MFYDSVHTIESEQPLIMKHILSELGYKHIHFIGIGGSGMYPLAQILHNEGYYLTGSDNNETETVDAVRKMGIPVIIGQKAENINGADLIIYTAAVAETNPELAAAKNAAKNAKIAAAKNAENNGVTVMERSELLGILSGNYGNTICVAGTHGKTTVSSMITEIFVDGGVDISAVIGGKLPCIGGSGRSGGSDTFVIESCEFKDHFLLLSRDIAVILNIDADHMDYFGNMERLKSSFRQFAENASKCIIANGSDDNTVDTLRDIKKEIITFGLTADNVYYPQNIQIVNPMHTEFDIYKHGSLLCHTALHVPGQHNILNAVAAAAAADCSDVPGEKIAAGLGNFRGAGRRFEKYGEINGITVVDDYGHHPAELKVTLEAAMKMGYNRVWAVHQPFTFSRTATLLREFAEVLQIADKIVLTAIMGGREVNTSGIRTADLAALIPGAVFFEEEEHDRNFELVTDYVVKNARPGDLIITLGCGDINKVARAILQKL
jgi:UDP-N-acetylmuramate--alanine ligase